MLCPYCLADVKFEWKTVEGRASPGYVCPNRDCSGDIVPEMYVQDYGQYPPVVVSAVGFRGHGKTVYFGALFYALRKSGLARYWPNYHTKALSDDSLTFVSQNVSMLDQGQLPDANPKNFPKPTLIQVTGVPMQPKCTLLFYDTSGEAFEKASHLVRYGGFVRRAQTAMLLISVADLEDPATKMHELLNVYVLGMRELNARPRDQHLVIVFSQCDRLVQRFAGRWADLGDYLQDGTVDGLARPDGYMRRMVGVSDRLRAFTDFELDASEFVHLADDSFKSVSFSIMSSLGSQPHGRQLTAAISPRRVLDPLLWMMAKTKRGWFRWDR